MLAQVAYLISATQGGKLPFAKFDLFGPKATTREMIAGVVSGLGGPRSKRVLEKKKGVRRG